MLEVPSRKLLGTVLDTLQLEGPGVEIGVRFGKFSVCMLTTTKLTPYVMVDPWKHYPATVYKDSANEDQAQQDQICINVTRKMRKAFGARAEILRMESLPAASTFPDNHFVFVYIDANHSYEYVKVDLAAWWPKLRSGGLFAGHDYVQRPAYGVQQAVNEFRAAHNIRHMCTTHADRSPSWYWVKP